MAEQAREGTPTPGKSPFTMRTLWRQAMWGTAAAASLLAAVVAGYSEIGSQRLMAATTSPSPAVAAAPNPLQIAREVELEQRRLADTVRVLTADRDRLVARVGTLERNLEDITSSIKRQAAAVPSAPPAAAAPPAPVIAAPATTTPSTPKETAAPAPETIVAARTPSAPAEPQPAAAEPAPPPAATDDAHAEGKAEHAVELGGAASFDGVRALWISLKSAHAAALEGLHPNVKVRENARTKAVELRLLAGPLASAEAASQLCGTLATARRFCQPAAFEGQRLAQADQAPPERKPAQRPAQPVQRSAWPFR